LFVGFESLSIRDKEKGVLHGVFWGSFIFGLAAFLSHRQPLLILFLISCLHFEFGQKLIGEQDDSDWHTSITALSFSVLCAIEILYFSKNFV